MNITVIIIEARNGSRYVKSILYSSIITKNTNIFHATLNSDKCYNHNCQKYNNKFFFSFILMEYRIFRTYGTYGVINPEWACM